jgi:GH25 family lysozyme M1 (1,4-beta-N-acetylmuramidase)
MFKTKKKNMSYNSCDLTNPDGKLKMYTSKIDISSWYSIIDWQYQYENSVLQMYKIPAFIKVEAWIICKIAAGTLVGKMIQ